MDLTMNPSLTRTATAPADRTFPMAELWQVAPDYTLKRCIDVALAGTMLLLTAPLFVLIAVAIKLEDGGPVFFTQERWGRWGERFRVHKFRSMRSGPVEVVVKPAGRNDARVTRVGRVLRGMALDELPQLWSVLRGDMSFVGPRPLAVGEARPDTGCGLVEDIPGFFERLAVRPGLTSLATIYIPKDSPPEVKFRYDGRYIARRRLSLDLHLIVMSIFISLLGRWESRCAKLAGIAPGRHDLAGREGVIRMPIPIHVGRRAAVLLLTVGVVFSAVPVTAQQSAGEGRDEFDAQVQALMNADLKLGPFFIRPGVGVGTAYESVPIRGNSDEPPQVVGDAVFKLSPRLDVVMPFRGQHEIKATGQLIYNWYSRFSELRNWDRIARASYRYRGDWLDVRVADDLTDRQVSFLDYVGDGGSSSNPQFDLDTRHRERRNNTFARVGITKFHRTDLQFRGGYETIRYKEDLIETDVPLSDELDRNEASFGTTARLRARPKTTVGIVYDYLNADYVETASFRDHGTHRIAGLLELDRSAGVFGSVELGYRNLSPRSPDETGFNGVVFKGRLGTIVGQRIRVWLNGVRDTTPTFWDANIFALRHGAGGEVEVPLSTDFTLSGDIGRFWLDYPVETTASLVDGSVLTAERRDRVWNYGATFGWTKDRNQSYRLRIGYYDRASNFDTQSLHGWRVSTGVQFSR